MSKVTIQSVSIRHYRDEFPDLSYLADASKYVGCNSEDVLKYQEQDAERLRAYYRGDWSCIGIRAEAVIIVGINNGSGISQKVTSGGFWGIESDSGDYIREVGLDQLLELRDVLESLGISNEEIDRAIDLERLLNEPLVV